MDDWLAIQKCLAGDWESFRHLVEHYQGRAVAHAVAIVTKREDALDAVQEAFLDAFQALGGFDQERQFYPWLYAILRNRCFKLLAVRKKYEVNSLVEIRAEILSPSSGLSPDQLLALERALLALTPEDRELITLKHLDGLSYRELAERLGIAEGTVMSRLYYARQRLREHLTLVR